MKKNQTRPLRVGRDENALTMIAPPGRCAADTFPSYEAAMAAMFGWALSAHASGRDLSSLAAWFNRQDPSRVVVTLAEREFFKRLSRVVGNEDADATAALSFADPRDTLRIFIVDRDWTGASSVTLAEMKEALYGR